MRAGISVRLAPRLPHDRTRPVELDLTAPDERVVEEALASGRLLGVDVALLTDEMTPLQAARDVGLSAFAIPEAWLLPPEPSDTDKQLRNVQRQVEQLLAKGPSLQVEVLHAEAVIPRLDGALLSYPALSPEFINRAVNAIRAAHPMNGMDDHAYVSMFGVEKYRGDYEKWASDLPQRIEGLPRYFNAFAPPASLSLWLMNEGISSADNVVVDIFARGDIYIVDPSSLDRIRRKVPPMLPQPEFKNVAPLGYRVSEAVREYSSKPAFPSIAPVPRREFQWECTDGEALSQHLQGECIDFRHALDPHVKELGIRAAADANEDVAGAIDIRVSARNVAVPVEVTVPVRLRLEFQDSEQRAAELIEQELGVRM